MHGSVRVVAMVNPQGRVEFVHPVTGPGKLVPAALESVRQWTFRPMLRDGKPEHGTAVVDVPFGL
jgi:outer membrane biosynthesis protein TonB